MTKNLFSRRQ